MASNLYEQVVGQEQALSRLRRMVAEDRVPHALLFTGMEGSGHLPAAIAFSQHLLCRSRTEAGGCGKCPSCTKVAGLVHPDLHLAFPIALSKKVRSSDALIAEFREAYLNNPYITLDDWFNAISAENKQPVIPVEEASSILRKLSITSFEGFYRIMIIWQAEKMNTEASNRLLKIIEEPPEQTVFVLVSSAPDALLPTIISRVQQVGFTPVGKEAIVSALVSRFGVDAAIAGQAAVMADGNFGEAVAILSSDSESVSLLEAFQSFMRLALRFDAAKAVEWIDGFSGSGREKHKQFMQYGLAVLRDCLMYNFGAKELVKLSGKELQFLEKFAPFVTRKNYDQLVSEFNSNYYYIERNANPKILFMDLALKTNSLLNMK
jgi:DNA polymerase III subunit delta'